MMRQTTGDGSEFIPSVEWLGLVAPKNMLIKAMFYIFRTHIVY